MGLLDNLFGALAGKSGNAAEPDQIGDALSGLLTQNGGLQGLIGKLTRGGLGNAVSSWVGMGENETVAPETVHNALGADQIKVLAAKLGVDPSQASGFLAEYLPKIIDKLTPTGQVDAHANHQQGLSALLPSLLQSLGGAGR